jgi:hypothetical protein
MGGIAKNTGESSVFFTIAGQKMADSVSSDSREL